MLREPGRDSASAGESRDLHRLRLVVRESPVRTISLYNRIVIMSMGDGGNNGFGKERREFNLARVELPDGVPAMHVHPEHCWHVLASAICSNGNRFLHFLHQPTPDTVMARLNSACGS